MLAQCPVGRETAATCHPKLPRVCVGVILCRGRDRQGAGALPIYTKESNKGGKESSSLPLKLKVGFYQGLCVYQVFLYGRLYQVVWVLSGAR